MAEDQEEVESLKKEFDWILHGEVHHDLDELHAVLTEASRRFAIPTISGEDNLVKPDKFLLSSQNGMQYIRCMVTLLGDSIIEADLTLRIHKHQPSGVKSNIYPDASWKIQQIQDAGNHLKQALWYLDGREHETPFQSSLQVLQLLDHISHTLNLGRDCLALPKKRSLEELIKNHKMRAFKPTLPSDTVISFYVQAQKLVLAVYQLYINQSSKLDIGTKYQVECIVPWLNDTLALFTIALQLCQQLRDKVAVFSQYGDESVLLSKKTVKAGQAQTARF